MSAMKKKARVDEIEKILRALLGDFQYCDIGNKQASCYPNVAIDALWLRRKLRALVSKAICDGADMQYYLAHENSGLNRKLGEIKERYGITVTP